MCPPLENGLSNGTDGHVNGESNGTVNGHANGARNEVTNGNGGRCHRLRATSLADKTKSTPGLHGCTVIAKSPRPEQKPLPARGRFFEQRVSLPSVQVTFSPALA